MVEQNNNGGDELSELSDRKKLARKSRRNREEANLPLNINSMMDMMTIILVFLLKSYGAEPIQITENDDLRLPFSNTELAPEDMLVLTITKKWVLVEDQTTVSINEGRIDPSALQSPDSAIIPELQTRIEEKLSEQEQWARIAGREFERVVTIVSDRDTPYRVVTQVMITASAAGVQNFKFAVMQREQGSGLMVR